MVSVSVNDPDYSLSLDTNNLIRDSPTCIPSHNISNEFLFDNSNVINPAWTCLLNAWTCYDMARIMRTANLMSSFDSDKVDELDEVENVV